MKNKKNQFMSFLLQQEEGKWQQILRVIDASNSRRGVKVTKKALEEMIKNFNANILNLKPNELQVNYSHESWGEAAGWITELRIKGKYLEAQIRWTPAATQKITDEEFRYFSAEFAPAWENVETQEVHTNMLLGAALTNIPFVPGMKAVALSDVENTEESIFIFTNSSQMNFKELLTAFQGNKKVSLSEATILRTMLNSLESGKEEFEADVKAIETLAQANADALEKSDLEAKAAVTKLTEDLASATEKLSSGDVNHEMTQLKSDLKLSQTTTKALQSQVDAMQFNQRKTEVSARVEELAKVGKILPKDKQATIDLALSQGNEEKQNTFLDYLDAMAPKVDFSETGSAAAQDATEEAKVAKITALAAEAFAKDPSVSLADHITRFAREQE